MTRKRTKTPRTTKLSPELLEWLEKNKHVEWENLSQGICRCVRIAKRVFEIATDEEFNKFVHPERYNKKKK